jgi:hypothetical protein
MRRPFIYLIVAVALVVATASSAQTVNWGAKSALLDLNMTEQQVSKTVGTAPNKVDMDVCGSGSAALRCKIHTYGKDGYGHYDYLKVYFQQTSDGTWRVYAWRVHN